MKIHYWGTSSTEAIPGIFCNCEVCNSLRDRKDAGDAKVADSFRTRTQTLIDDEILIDFGPDSYYNAVRRGVSLGNLGMVLQTHSHNDHYLPQDLCLRRDPYAYACKYPVLKVVGSAVLKEQYEFFRELAGEAPGPVEFIEAQPFRGIVWGDYTVTPLPSHHMKTEQTFVYTVEKGGACYLCCNDTGILPEETFAFLAKRGKEGRPITGAAFDCALGDSGFCYEWHMGVEDAIATKARLIRSGAATERTRFLITHISHDYGHRPYEEYETFMRPHAIAVAKDGLTVELEEKR